MERTETISSAALDYKKNSRRLSRIFFRASHSKPLLALYQNLITHKTALKSLWKIHQKHLEREKQLGDILEALKTGYNPNYQDMAVLEAVKGWEALRPAENSGEEEPALFNADDFEDREWTEDQLKYQLDPILNQDYVALLLAHENHINHETTSLREYLNYAVSVLFLLNSTLVTDLVSYLPESLLPTYEAAKNTILSWLQAVGIIKSSAIDSAGE